MPQMLEVVSTNDDFYHQSLRGRIINTCDKLITVDIVLFFADIIGSSPADFCAGFVDVKIFL